MRIPGLESFWNSMSLLSFAEQLEQSTETGFLSYWFLQCLRSDIQRSLIKIIHSCESSERDYCKLPPSCQITICPMCFFVTIKLLGKEMDWELPETLVYSTVLLKTTIHRTDLSGVLIQHPAVTSYYSRKQEGPVYSKNNSSFLPMRRNIYRADADFGHFSVISLFSSSRQFKDMRIYDFSWRKSFSKKEIETLRHWVSYLNYFGLLELRWQCNCLNCRSLKLNF